MKMKRLPRLFESGSMNPPMMGPCVSSSLLGVYWQYYNPEKGCPSAVLLFLPKSFFKTLFNLFDILFKTSTSEYSSKT
jgi:hypothetical protein